MLITLLDDVANSWATSVSSRSISYRQAMVLGTIFEMVGAIAVGARTASTIKNGIIPLSAFNNNPGIQMLAFTCAIAAASSWVMWCTRNSVHVSSTYSLISAIAGVGVATVGASNVQWGWNNGTGLGAIFAGLVIAPVCSAGFAAIIFMLIKLIVLVRKNPLPWAVYTSPFWFLLASCLCTLSIVYKGSPSLGLASKPTWYVVAVTLGTAGGVCLLSAIFFLPYLHARIIKRDASVKWWMVIMGPLLWKRPTPAEDAQGPIVPNYSVVQKEVEDDSSSEAPESVTAEDNEKSLARAEVAQLSYQELMAQSEAKRNAKLYKVRGPLGWAMRTLRDNPWGAGEIYELKNIIITCKRVPAMIVCALLYGVYYDIHLSQTGVAGTPDGRRMEVVYSHAKKYPNEVEHTYSFIQVITACTASFAHGSNDIGNSVGPWAVIYYTWSTGLSIPAKTDIPIWQLAVLSATLSVGLITYGYNIMTGM